MIVRTDFFVRAARVFIVKECGSHIDIEINVVDCMLFDDTEIIAVNHIHNGI